MKDVQTDWEKKEKEKEKEKEKRKNFIVCTIWQSEQNAVLTRDGKSVPVCGIDRAKVDYSIFGEGGIVQKGNGGKIDFDAQ